MDILKQIRYTFSANKIRIEILKFPAAPPHLVFFSHQKKQEPIDIPMYPYNIKKLRKALDELNRDGASEFLDIEEIAGAYNSAFSIKFSLENAGVQVVAFSDKKAVASKAVSGILSQEEINKILEVLAEY